MSTSNNKCSTEKQFLIRIPVELHDQLRFLSYQLNISMAQLCRKGLELIIRENKRCFEKRSQSNEKK